MGGIIAASVLFVVVIGKVFIGITLTLCLAFFVVHVGIVDALESEVAYGVVMAIAVLPFTFFAFLAEIPALMAASSIFGGCLFGVGLSRFIEGGWSFGRVFESPSVGTCDLECIILIVCWAIIGVGGFGVQVCSGKSR